MHQKPFGDRDLPDPLGELKRIPRRPNHNMGHISTEREKVGEEGKEWRGQTLTYLVITCSS